MQHAVITPSTATTTALVAAHGAGSKIVVYGLHLGTNAAQQIDVDNGSTLLHRVYLPATSAVTVGFNGTDDVASRVLWECADNAALNVDTAAATGAVAEAWYDVVDT